MPLLKRTYALPADVVSEFEGVVAPGKRSMMVSTLMAEWVERQRREKLAREVVEGCRKMAATYLAVEKEYHALEEEVERGSHLKARAEERPQTRRRRTGSA